MSRMATFAMALLCALVLMLVPGPATASAQGCPDVFALGGQASQEQLERSLLCVVNVARKSIGRRPLASSRKLRKAARMQASDMTVRAYFSHTSPTGSTLADRLQAARWTGIRAGEALAYGCGDLQTPMETVNGWLASPEHRRILMGKKMRRAGVAAVAGQTPGGCTGITWAFVAGA